MKKTRIFAAALAFTAITAVPALAAWDRIGAINVSYQVDRDSASPNFGGPVERLMFTARGSDVSCRYIRATFDNGQTRDLFSGRLSANRGQSADMPGTQRSVRRIKFKCHALDRRSATVEIAADIGRYRDTWRKSPDWNRVWARMFNWR